MTTVVLNPLRKQGDVSKLPAAPTAVLLQGSSAPPTATLPRTQGSSTSPTATLACTQGLGTSLPDTLVHSYTPIVHLDSLLASIKGRSRALMREGRAGGRADEQAHSLSLASVCNPYYERIPSAQDNTSRVSPPLCSISRQPIWVGTRSDNFTRRSRDSPGSKRRQVATVRRVFPFPPSLSPSSLLPRCAKLLLRHGLPGLRRGPARHSGPRCGPLVQPPCIVVPRQPGPCVLGPCARSPSACRNVLNSV
jgi:hypothetical protein